MVFIHELGHFLTARAFGVGIEKFSIGFGKPLYTFRRNGVEWRIGWIPLGGYVKMKGENPDETAAEEHLSFQKKAWWKRALIGFSGPFANLLLGFLLFIVSFFLPLNVEDQRPVVAKAEGVWSEVFAPGDSIQSVNGTPVTGFSQYLENLSPTKENRITVSRNGQSVILRVPGNNLDSLLVSLYPLVDTKVGEVIPKTPAYHAQIKAGDVITAVDSVQVADWYAMRELITGSGRDSVVLDIRRGQETLRKGIQLESSLSTGSQKAIGIMQDQPVKYVRHFAFIEAVKLGSFNGLNFIRMNYQMLFKLLQRPSELKKNVGGPVMIVSLSQQIGNKGFSYLLLFFGSISLMLMIMNLLPIPILDGGLIMFAIIEGIIRRPIPLRVQSILQTIGFLLLMLLMVMAFYSDISSEILRYLSR